MPFNSQTRTSSPVQDELEPLLGGGGPRGGNPSHNFGGDDSDNSGRGNILSYNERLRRCRLGLGLSMASVLMLFVALTSAYLLRQHTSVMDDMGHNVSNWRHLTLPPLLLINTLLLLASSFTLEMARRSLLRRAVLAPIDDIPGIRPEPQRSLPWLAITLVLGIGFVLGQITVWRTLEQQGVYAIGNPSSSFFYILTGVHALHLTLGICALLYAALAHLFSKALETRCLIVDVTSWYWHFMGVLWLYIYGLLYFAR